MLFPKPVSRTRSEKRSIFYRNYFFMFTLLLFLTSLFAVQAVAASGLNFNDTLAKQVGYVHMQQQVTFSQAKIAFENQNYTYSALILRLLAQAGHAKAQYLLATQYDLGLGVKRSVSDAFYWYKKAASAGIHMAQHNLAVAYARGNGVQTDLVKAVSWWKRAAKAGNTDSQYNLGIIYAAGRDSIKPDMKKAIKWWRMAAISGDPVAQFNLGALYVNGIGISSRTCEAVRWWKKSAASGFAQAKMALAFLQSKSNYLSCSR